MTEKHYYSIDTEGTAKKLKFLISESKYSVRDISEYIGVGVNAIYRWTRGETIPEITNLFALADLLNVPVGDLLVIQKW